MACETFERRIVENALREVLGYIWETVLDKKLEPATSFGACSGVEASVTIQGAWAGVLRIQTTSELAEQITARMYGTGQQSAPRWEDIQDALREITNIAGGNLKTVLPAECQLGIPQTIEAEFPAGDERLGIDDRLELQFQSCSQPLKVILETTRT